MQKTINNPNDEFDQIVEDYYRAWFRFHPETAVNCGHSQFAGELTPISNSSIGALRSLHDDLLGSLEEVSYQQLDDDHQLDFDALIGQAYLERQAILQSDWRFRDPQKYLPFNAIDQLLQRPVTGFARSLSARLKATPDYLWQAQALIRRQPEAIPHSWLEQTIESAKSGDGFMQTLADHPKVVDAIHRGPSLMEEIAVARKSIQSFRRFLENEVASLAQGDSACGEHRFNKLLQLNHGLEISHHQLYEFGEKLAETTYKQLKQQCKQITGHEDIAQLVDALSQNHPASEDLVSTYQQTMMNSKAFAEENDLLTMPKNDCLEVIETPVYLRHQIPFAAYQPPMVNDPAQKGLYYVTPAKDAELAEHHYLSIKHTCVHEAYPGHHLQFVTANINPASRSWPRILNTSATMYEGWALYCEQLSVEKGYLNDPLSEFILLKDRLWRALRVMIDVDLHVNQVPGQIAAQRLCDRLGFTKAQAMADTSWYTHAPTVPMGYALGWAMLNTLREQQQPMSSFSLKSFHNKILASGSISLAWVIRRQFGADSLNDVMKKITG